MYAIERLFISYRFFHALDPVKFTKVCKKNQAQRIVGVDGTIQTNELKPIYFEADTRERT
jgi:hypothetical protein